ncbi:hypothetical protein ACQPZG_01690 (plasmid) [Streptomyces sp. CA-294286]|uniref:hypothetical protein n=1 Tax=Streptomyces sp. CA-294286 TaxID=3240070 RepID=UPI003D8F1559
MSEPTWVPQSCTLPSAEQPLRSAEWDALFCERLAAITRPRPLRLRLHLSSGGEGVEERVRDLVAREGDCCSFFTFTTRADGDRTVLEIEVDRLHEPVLNALAARAAAVVEREVPPR